MKASSDPAIGALIDLVVFCANMASCRGDCGILRGLCFPARVVENYPFNRESYGS